MTNRLNILGALLSVISLIICCLIFIFRMGHQPQTEHYLGITLILTGIPLLYLLSTSKKLQRPPIYSVQIGLMILFLFAELLLDYVLDYPFREIRWMAISYVMLFFAATGGLIGVASRAGQIWSIIAIILFFNMVALAFFQHAQTGM